MNSTPAHITSSSITPKTDDQRNALDALRTFLSGDEPMFSLKGYAGTGKSTIAFAIAQEYMARGKQVAFTAPTNKAVRVGSKIAASRHLTGMQFATIHSFLGLALVKKNGEKVLTQKGTSSAAFTPLTYLDECSMVSEELWDWTTRSFNRHSKLILMGDPAQLYPVGEGRSPTFSKDIPGVTLKQVVRQAEGSPLMDYITSIRRSVTQRTEGYKGYKPTNIPKGQDQVQASSRTEALKYATTMLDAFEFEPDSFRIVAWRNEMVDNYNHHLRRKRHGANAPTFVPGERLIAREPILAPDKKTVLVQTSTEFVVLGVRTGEYGHYKAWALTVQVEGSDTPITIYTVHDDDKHRFDNETKRLKAAAIRQPFLWRTYYDHLETFAQVRPCYALTVHNSQGSTFEKVIIDGVDLAGRLYCQNGETKTKAFKEHNRLWYVGASRASTKLVVVTTIG